MDGPTEMHNAGPEANAQLVDDEGAGVITAPTAAKHIVSPPNIVQMLEEGGQHEEIEQTQGLASHDDSGLEDCTDGDSSETMSLSTTMYPMENGRRYHALSQGKYMLPNDEAERERLDFQHELFKLTFDGEICLCPGAATAQRVLDVGTGTGIWAIEFADDHPRAEVIGVDLSPIQPIMLPPNLRFSADDFEMSWTYSKFDYVFFRQMAGCLASVPEILHEVYNNLVPGGYIEFQDKAFPIRVDDDTLPQDAALYKWSTYIIEASIALGRPINTAHTYKDLLTNAGFENVVETQFTWPQNNWPQDPKLKELGLGMCENIDNGLEAMSLFLFSHGLGWNIERIYTFLIDVRKDIRDPNVHAYWSIYVVHGQRPLSYQISPHA
ncbi:S-adenosyl-L-methionine-dependent methyltransferase [Calycina marina]|uniref:S-adenosyl-L-methionine-dependent methyltransferase n=1 Tax=Calycina marina TaxID=1763456 RepID=A0A9P7YYZ2_9HELO|nr:S-adenosyl-L-methionine-dependent methyltransferase [Calycina marina]